MLLFRQLAINNIGEAFHWYENHRKNLGEEFLEDLRRVLLSIEKFLKAFQQRESGYRSLFLKGFPFEVVYSELDKEIMCLEFIMGNEIP